MAPGVSSWVQSYTKSPFLPPPINIRVLTDIISNERKELNLTRNGSKSISRNLRWTLSGILLILGLATQVSYIQASGTTPKTGDIGIQAAQGTAVSGNGVTTDGTDRSTFPLDVSAGSGSDQHTETKQEFNHEMSHRFDETHDVGDVFVNILGSDKNGDILAAVPSQRLLSPVTESSYSLPKYCRVSSDELRKMILTVDGTFFDVPVEESACGSLVTFGSSIVYADFDMCDELLNIVQCRATDFRNEFMKIFSNNSTLSDDLMDCKQNYSSFSENIAREIDLKNLNLQQCEGVNRVLEMRNEGLSELVSDLQQQLNTAIVNLCSSEIGLGRIENAVTEFRKLKNTTHLVNIIKLSYSAYGKLDSVYNIITFIEWLFICKEQLIAYQALFDMIKENNYLDSSTSPYILLPVKECMANTTFAYELRKHVTKIIDSWSNEVRNNDYNHILEFSKLSEKHANTTSSLLPSVIVNAYNNDLSNFDSVLNLLPKLPRLEHQYVAYTALFEEMRMSGQLYSSEIIRLAFHIRETMATVNVSVLQPFSRKFQELKDCFPHFVWQLLEKPTCKIKSNYWNEYLYVPVPVPRYGEVNGGPDRYAFTWLDPWDGGGGPGDWSLVPVDGAKYFYISNSFYSTGTCYVSEMPEQTYVVCSHKIVKAEWKIEPEQLDGKDVLFKIKNRQNESLYAADRLFTVEDTVLRRHVSVWQRSQPPYGEMWKIFCN